MPRVANSCQLLPRFARRLGPHFDIQGEPASDQSNLLWDRRDTDRNLLIFREFSHQIIYTPRCGNLRSLGRVGCQGRNLSRANVQAEPVFIRPRRSLNAA